MSSIHPNKSMMELGHAGASERDLGTTPGSGGRTPGSWFWKSSGTWVREREDIRGKTRVQPSIAGFEDEG